MNGETSVLQSLTNWGGAIVAGVGGLLLLVRRLSRDRIELAKDSIEHDVLKGVLKDRDDARDEVSGAVDAQRQCEALLAGVTAEKDHLVRQVEDMNHDFQAFQRKIGRLYPATRPFLDSAMMPLTEDGPK